MNKGIYRAFYSIDGDDYTYVRICAYSRAQAKDILDSFLKHRVGRIYDSSPMPDYLCKAYTWGVGEVHGDDDHDYPDAYL